MKLSALRASLLALLLWGIPGLVTAAVTGPKTTVGTYGEIFADREWPRGEYADWLQDPSALLTPESLALALQSCLRDSQEKVDALAYDVARELVTSMGSHYGSGGGDFERSLRAIAALLEELNTLPADLGRDGYERSCGEAVEGAFSRHWPHFDLLYHARLHPKPVVIGNRRIELGEMTRLELKEKICRLEGYYGTSPDHRLWKFFSTTRVLGNILPAEERNEAFLAAVHRAPREILDRLRALDRYSMVAGKPNGPSAGLLYGASSPEFPRRRTGGAMGSRSASLLALFTTAWRERLQTHIFERPYGPGTPFRLLEGREILEAVGEVAGETRPDLSATELAMGAVWKELWPWIIPVGGSPAPRSPVADYGWETRSYLKAASLAWLALNAETNVRQNEKLTGVRFSLDPRGVTRQVFGNREAYGALSKALASAQSAYGAVGASPSHVPCGRDLARLLAEAQSIADGSVGIVSEEAAQPLARLTFPPVIVDLGTEVEDADQGIFRLHLATGGGRVVPAVVGERSYRLWTPSGFVLHLPDLLTTDQWKAELLRYEP